MPTSAPLAPLRPTTERLGLGCRTVSRFLLDLRSEKCDLEFEAEVLRVVEVANPLGPELVERAFSHGQAKDMAQMEAVAIGLGNLPPQRPVENLAYGSTHLHAANF